MEEKIDPVSWRPGLEAFREKTRAFYAGEMDKGAYKGFSGLYGSYAQRGGTASMLRLRMTAGRVTQKKLAFVAEMIRTYPVHRVHFTTCQAIQFHDLDMETAWTIMDKALDAGIVTMGGGGDYPRNVMCSPLTGTEPDENFDVLPYAEAAAEYLMPFILKEKMPRKLKVCFSNSPKNVPHATYRDLGFGSRPDGCFDVYSAGGLGNNPKFGVKVAEKIDPSMILYYIKAMWLTFRTYGNYENRGKARTRYMQDACGGPDEYKKKYCEKLEEVLASGEDLKLTIAPAPAAKKGDGTAASGKRVLAQKQEGLYTVSWHPQGGQPKPEVLCAVSDAVCAMEGAEMRIAPDETAYIINLTGAEAEKILAITECDAQKTLFETSVSCIGASICQVGVRDSQALLAACIKAVREADLPDGALPQIHISGCPSSCGTHQTGLLGFRGGAKNVGGKVQPAFVFFVNGCDLQGSERMGREVGTMLQERIPEFLVEIGRAAAASGKSFEEWMKENPVRLDEIAAAYLV